MSEREPARAAERTPFDAILDEQRTRWEAGERPPVEEFLARAPGPARQTRGRPRPHLPGVRDPASRSANRPSPAEYLRRFPAWSEALARQFAVDEAMRPVEPAGPRLGGRCRGDPAGPGSDPGRIEAARAGRAARRSRATISSRSWAGAGWGSSTRRASGGSTASWRSRRSPRPPSPRRRSGGGSWPRPRSSPGSATPTSSRSTRSARSRAGPTSRSSSPRAGAWPSGWPGAR